MATRLQESFFDTVRKRQVSDVLKTLTKQKDRGEIRTVDEFVNRLDALVRELNATTLVPTLKLYEAKANELIDSESFDFMLERIQDDLSVGFEEVDKLDEVQKSHDAIIRDVVLNTIQSGLAELEAKISFYEFMNKSQEGFDISLYSTFKGSIDNRTARSVDQSGVFFTDPRTGNSLDTSNDAEIDSIGECLILPYTAKDYSKIVSIKPGYTSTTFPSFLNINREDNELNDLSRVIDGVKGTYWMSDRIIVSETDKANPAPFQIRLELDLGGFVNINFVEIEVNGEYPPILEDIEYQTDTGSIVSLDINDLDADDFGINKSARVYFKRISTQKLILVFRCEDFTFETFTINEGV
jgi:hypothetical protein